MTSLFSNLRLNGDADSPKLTHQPGSVVSSAALVAGTTVGAGVLALPAVTYPVGVIPSTVLMVLAWLYMLASGLLVAEANLWAMRVSGRPELGLLATVARLLGKNGAITSGVLYIFIHYALLVAYIARGGDILAAVLDRLGNRTASLQAIPLWLGHVVFVLLLGGVLYFCSMRVVGWLNIALVVIVIATFGLLVGLTAEQVEPSRWQVQHWEAIGLAVPVMFVAFVYQNVVPVVTTQLEGDGQRVRWAIGLGSLVPLAMFALWNAVILGSMQWDGVIATGDVVDPLELLRLGVGHPRIGAVVSIFSEVAIATSFIGFVFGLLSVFEDIFAGLMTTSAMWVQRSKKLFFYSLVLLPPLALSVLDPNIFYNAIDVAGAYGNSILFGIIPAVMVWKFRYPTVSSQEGNISDQSHTLVPGGKGLLLLMISIAIAVIIQNVMLK